MLNWVVKKESYLFFPTWDFGGGKEKKNNQIKWYFHTQGVRSAL